MELLKETIGVFLHLDQHLNEWAGMMGPWLYGLLFLIIFCETGLVVTPFLPGDSLLFAVGALAASPDSPIHIVWVAALLVVAAVVGDAVNFQIGKHVGPKVFRSDTSRLLNRQHLLRAQRFYEKHGGKTIFLARFIPIIRTFAPFVAGIGQMNYFRFAMYNVVGGLTWVLAFLIAGYGFGNLPWVKDGFHWVILAIIVISVVPVVVEWWRARREAKLAAFAVLPLEAPQTGSSGDGAPMIAAGKPDDSARKP